MDTYDISYGNGKIIAFMYMKNNVIETMKSEMIY